MVVEGKRSTRSDENSQNTKTVIELNKCSSINNRSANSNNSKNNKLYLNESNFVYDKDLRVLYTNADCFSNKINDLLDLLSSLESKPSIIAIT